MRILVVADHFPPASGGLAVQAQRLSERLGARGHHVTAVSVGQSPEREQKSTYDLIRLRLSLNRIRGIYQPGSPIFHPPWPDPEFRHGLQEVVDRVQPDLIHVHGWSVFSVAALCNPRRAIIATLHDYGMVCPKKSLMRHGATCATGFGLRCATCDSADQPTPRRSALAAALAINLPWAVPRVHRWLAVSEYVAAAHRRVPGIAERTLVVPPLVDLPTLDHSPPEDPPYLLYAGPGDENPDKGRAVLLEAFARASVDGLRLVLVGGRDPIMGPHIEDRGYLAGTDLQAAFRGASFAAVPSVWPDPCPAVAVEALAWNRPVVASDVGGLSEIVEHGRTGMLVPARDADALAQAIRRVATEEGTRKGMSVRARASVERFSTKVVLDIHEDTYEELARSSERESCA